MNSGQSHCPQRIQRKLHKFNIKQNKKSALREDPHGVGRDEFSFVNCRWFLVRRIYGHMKEKNEKHR